MKISRLAAVLATALMLGTAGSALAQSAWDQAHPRRAEVNGRLANQNRRIHQEVRTGEITRTQAHRLHRQDRAIRHEERAMARRNGGAITPREQHTLNRQENAVGREIGH